LLLFLSTHVFLLLLPLLIQLGPTRLPGDVAFIAFLVFASLLCLVDVAAAPCGGELRPAQAHATGTQAHGLALATGAGILVVFWTAMLHRNCAASPAAAIVSAAGGLLMLVGVALRYAAIRALGRFFVTEITVAPAQQLIQRGIYRFIRHPSETGNLAVAFGASLLLGSLSAALLCIAVLLPLVLLRTAREDRFLAGQFGGEFRRYRARVKRLLPAMY
jgi:protein-S-isoprenylcysteine O-methyltransferase